MLKIDKVIRIEIPAVNFQDEISADVSEWWTIYEDLEERPQTLKYLQMFYKEELQALKDGDIDYISLYYDIF
jgi:hypothetical protein